MEKQRSESKLPLNKGAKKLKQQGDDTRNEAPSTPKRATTSQTPNLSPAKSAQATEEQVGVLFLAPFPLFLFPVAQAEQAAGGAALHARRLSEHDISHLKTQANGSLVHGAILKMVKTDSKCTYTLTPELDVKDCKFPVLTADEMLKAIELGHLVKRRATFKITRVCTTESNRNWHALKGLFIDDDGNVLHRDIEVKFVHGIPPHINPDIRVGDRIVFLSFKIDRDRPKPGSTFHPPDAKLFTIFCPPTVQSLEELLQRNGLFIVEGAERSIKSSGSSSAVPKPSANLLFSGDGVTIDCRPDEDDDFLDVEEEDPLDARISAGLPRPRITQSVPSPSKSISKKRSGDEDFADVLLSNGQRPSPHQQAIFSFIKDPNGGHGVIQAVAGSGKTGTLVKLWEFVPPQQKCIYLAYNKAVQRYLETLLSNAPQTRVHNKTIHAYARRIVVYALAKQMRSLRIIHLSEEKDVIFDVLGVHPPKKVKSLLSRAKELCQQSLAETKEEVHDILSRFKIRWALEKFNVTTVSPVSADRFEEGVMTLMDLTRKRFLNEQEDVFRCTFEDLIWLPCVLAAHIPVPQYDFVFVDEAQDLNKSQQAFVKRLVERLPNGRIIAVGDPHQAIYAFRGADLQAMDNMMKDLKAKRFGLTVSFRCPKRVVALAQSIAPELEAAPTAPEGIIRHLVDEAELIQQVKEGDFVLSRVNYPLIRISLAIARRGVPVVIQGKRDIITRMTEMVKQAKKKPNVAFGKVLEEICSDARRKQATGEKTSAYAEIVDACAQTLNVFYSLDTSAGVQGVEDRIAHYFIDPDDKTIEHSKLVTLSSVHQAKGLERKRVFVLRNTFRDGSNDREEDNIWYVAMTRAKAEFIIVGEAANWRTFDQPSTSSITSRSSSSSLSKKAIRVKEEDKKI